MTDTLRLARLYAGLPDGHPLKAPTAARLRAAGVETGNETAPQAPAAVEVDWESECPWPDRRTVLVELRAQYLFDRHHMTPEETWAAADEGRVVEPPPKSREQEAIVEGVCCFDCGRSLVRGEWDVLVVGEHHGLYCTGRRFVTCVPRAAP